ncbi:glucosamine-6-phosphate deaminase [Jeotgalibacillus campisalis]|uniref:Glucosamine-6-phosphate deaminase n=1 Tax=Jeotgalibacillus campisalis TaxID=220754 RepID=A0A0C2W8E5_9BACL|nr:glucosamine-6-phosphate deaminase [Jeotgalibacillus campisalis]
MNLIVVNHYEELSQKAAEIIEQLIQSHPASILGLATGSTPIGLYQELIKRYQQGAISFEKVRTINLDEYIGLAEDHPQSYHAFMKKHLFDEIAIPKEQTHLPNGNASFLDEECLRYERLIEKIGPADVQLLGIGSNGHIGFNEPGSSFSSETHVIKLAQSTREANARFFHSVDEVPSHAITMGIASILKSKKILLLASGPSKTAALRRLLQQKKEEAFPASVLCSHPHVTLIADREAWADLPQPETI